MNSDQLHRSTLSIYSNLMDDFNPSLQELASLGDSYIHAFKALALTSEAYFDALLKIGEKAFYTHSSRSLGGVLIQISENQRNLTLELHGLFRWFSGEVLQNLDNNTQQDKEYILDSRNRYEMEVHHQAAALERYTHRGINQDSEYMQFLRVSHAAALLEEERRYRFLAEKHCGLVQNIADLMNKLGGSLHQKAQAWVEEVSTTRHPSTGNNNLVIKSEESSRSRDELPLGELPSRVPSIQGSISHATGASMGVGGGGGATRALAAHQPAASNTSLLPFSKGELITVLVPQPKNGWLFGRAGSSSRQGWFPASYVETVGDTPDSISSSFSNASRRSSTSTGVAPPPAPPPLPSSTSSPSLPSLSTNRHSAMQPIPPAPDMRTESKSEIKKSQPHGSQFELFPRGTNPFVTVKLKPTLTNDRSEPRLNRR